MNNLTNEFENEIANQLVTPWVQLVNAGKMPLKDIEKFNVPWGVFIPQGQAEEVGFTPSGHWKEIEIEFEGSSDEPTLGYLTQSPRFVVIQRSRPECYKKNAYGSWRFQGLYFGDRLDPAAINWHEQIKLLTPKEQQDYRSVTRYLLSFVDSDNKPLHSGGLQLKLKGAGGLAISQSIADIYQGFEKAYFASIKKPPSVISPAGRARVVIDLKLGLEKAGSHNPQIVVEEMQSPGPAGTTQEVVVKNRTVKQIGVSLSSMLISTESADGAAFRQLHQDTVTFALPGGEVAGAVEVAEVEAEAQIDPDLMPF
jgi:hypothetical protein